MPAPTGVHRVSCCELVVSARRWRFAEDNAAEIDAHWVASIASNPALFNGTVHVTDASAFTLDGAGSVLRAELMRTEFKCYYYWRSRCYPDAGILDGFGSALIRSADGSIVLGRQREGNINAGFSYLPGGFIDSRDVGGDGSVDLDGSILREVMEETGLGPADVMPQPGYLVTFAGPLMSIARELRCSADADAIKALIRAHIASEREPELADAVIVRSDADLVGLAMPSYARVLLEWLFAGGRR